MKQVGFILCLLLVFVTAQAQVKKDSVAGLGFDATQKAFLKRYKHPDAVPFDTLWKNNIYISVFGGMDRMVPQGAGDFNMGPIGGAGVTWQFAPAHAVRGSLFLGSFARKIDSEILTRFGLQADYLMNISTFTSGYNPGRFFEFLTVAGVGYQMSYLLGKMEHVADLHLGFQFKLHPTTHVDFYLEPRVSLASDGIDHSMKKNFHGYDITYGAVVGLNYRFKSWQPFGKMKLLDGQSFLDNTFIDLAGGVQFQSSKLSKEVGLLKGMGPQVSVSVGKWLLPALALRLSGFKSADTWRLRQIEATLDEPADQFYEMSTYAGGRVEALVDATYYLNGNQLRPAFQTNVLLGAEVGMIKKESGRHPAKGAYTGFTTGLQLKYRLFDELSLFVEPRYTMASFSLRTGKKEMGRFVSQKFCDHLLGMNVGVQIERATEENRLARELNRELFEPSFFASGSLGFLAPIQVNRYEGKGLSYDVTAAAGRVFTPLSSARLSVDFGSFSNSRKLETLKYNLLSVGADYMLNVTNLMQGYDPERKYDVQLLAGIVGSMRLTPSSKARPQGEPLPYLPETREGEGDKPDIEVTPEGDGSAGENEGTGPETGGPEVQKDDLKKSKLFLGFELGAHLSYRINNRFKVFLEPKVRMYGKEMLMKSNIQGRDLFMTLQAGTTFTF